jgi:hypothetical protein
LPSPGDNFDFLTAGGGLSGAFDGVALAGYSGAFELISMDGRLSLALAAAPLPGTPWLLLLGLGVVLARSTGRWTPRIAVLPEAAHHRVAPRRKNGAHH